MKPGQTYNELKKADSDKPNTWFKFDHPDLGPLEVSAHVPKGAMSPHEVKIHGIGAPNDIQVTPEETEIEPKHIGHMQIQALSAAGKKKKK